MLKNDLLMLTDLTPEWFEQIVARSIMLKQHWEEREMPQTLKGLRVGIIEDLPGWRNPTALTLGVGQMGGDCVQVKTSLDGKETIEDLAGYMDNWFDLIAVRTPNLSSLQKFSEALVAPVINLRTNDNHPCEILGDLAFVKSERGNLEGLRVVIVGPAGNIARSWMEASALLPIHVTHVAPTSLMFSDVIEGCQFSSTDDISIIEEADLIVTDCWKANLSNQEKTKLDSLRIDARLLERCRSDVIFLPCPPVTRGEEVSSDAMGHPRCMSQTAKGFLLHAQNALVEAILCSAPNQH